ncbi:MAG: hypothetical protein JXA25_13010 [Anaerolineales bacterium]|nr:hypothetical protein [Anaerolineales bacterium]
MEQKPSIAVLTGDIVSFSDYAESTRKEILSMLNQAAVHIQNLYPAVLPYDIGLYRGDGWQLVVLNPSLALRIALLIRCILKTGINNKDMDTRIAIAIGAADYLPEGNIETGDGEVFRASGYLLESLSRQTHLGCRWPAAGSATVEEVLDAMLQLLDSIVNQWTVRQARAVTGALQGWRQIDIAQSWIPESISQQAVAQHLDSASWSVLSHAVGVFEKTVLASLSQRSKTTNRTS